MEDQKTTGAEDQTSAEEWAPDTEETAVIFRVWRAKPYHCIALMPERAADYRGFLCDSYMQLGQHGGADYYHVVSQTRPATPAEYADIKAEMEAYPYGYKFRILKRAPYSMHRKRMDSARNG